MSVSKIVAAAASSAGGGAGLDVDEVFSTTVYDGTGSAQTITNNIDLSSEGGLVWTKTRSHSTGHALVDTANGAQKYLISEGADSLRTDSYAQLGLTSFSSTGYVLGSDSGSDRFNRSGRNYVSWTFRKSNMFDVQTWTGNGATTQISHSLGSTPGFWVFKRTDTTAPWYAGHYDGTTTRYLQLNTSSDQSTSPHLAWGDFPNNSTVIPPTSTYVTFSGYLNVSGASFVGYFWASHANDGSATGFGPDGDSPVISCGSYSGTGSTGNSITVGFQPQWMMVKNTSASTPWVMVDVMRGMPVDGTGPRLLANASDAEVGDASFFAPRATGFEVTKQNTYVNTSGQTYIFMAIRRGSLFPPEAGDATKVFAIDTMANQTPAFDSNFPVDMAIRRNLDYATSNAIWSRLTGAKYMNTDSTAAESNDSESFDHMDGWGDGSTYSGNQAWMWKRAPSYFDVVAYTGTGSAMTINHNLGAVPEMMWVKNRSNSSYNWNVYHKDLSSGDMLFLSSTSAAVARGYFNNTAPTSTVFSVGVSPIAGPTSASGENYIAYLFASSNVSKVGSYTGDGTAGKVIDCGFSSGARFVLIKKSSGTGGWYVYDTTRGIVAGNDPYLFLNSTAAENDQTDSIDPNSSGFAVNYSNTNANGQTYIFYAIA